MPHQILFRCPRTGVAVQHRLDGAPPQRPAAGSHLAVRCLACASVHFVDVATGETLGGRVRSGDRRDERQAERREAR